MISLWTLRSSPGSLEDTVQTHIQIQIVSHKYHTTCSHLFPHDMSQGEPTPGLFASPSFQRPHVCNGNPKMLATNFHHALSDWPCWKKRHSPRDLHWWKSGEHVLPAPNHQISVAWTLWEWYTANANIQVLRCTQFSHSIISILFPEWHFQAIISYWR